MSREFNDSIKRCIQKLSEMECLTHTVSISSLQASNEFKKACKKQVSYRSLYETAIANSDFNFMLFDNSFFQFTETKQDEEVRMAFYPNPYNSTEYKNTVDSWQSLLEEGSLSQAEFEQILAEEVFSCDTPLIRYDLSLKQYCKNYHPAAHLHIGFHANNRWPVKKVLSPYAFLLKIICYYYGDLWKKHGDNGDEPNTLDLIYRAEIASCKMLHDDYFQPHERERLHFT